jgi:predicted TIM-barrel fold metal-dependent hydrolase
MPEETHWSARVDRDLELNEQMSLGSVIDSCAFYDWPSKAHILQYVEKGWRELLAIENVHIKGEWQNAPFAGPVAADRPSQAWHPPASDPGEVIQQLFEDRGCERVVLGHEQGLLSAGLPMAYKARVMVRAINDWTIAEWFARDRRLFGHLLVQSALPDEAATEIRRVERHRQFVAVAMGANGLNQPFGHPVYKPIYDAAAEFDLPIVVQVGADNIADVVTTPTAVGLSATYAEYEALSAAPLMTHVVSMLTSGVFETHPNLRVLLVGGGVAWVPELLWRLDPMYGVVRRVDMPWSKRLPSETFVQHIRLATYSLEAPAKPEQLESALDLIPHIESMLLYASGYPNAKGELPGSIAARLPRRLHRGVFHANAEAFYRWPGTPSKTVVSDGAEKAARAQAGRREGGH